MVFDVNSDEFIVLFASVVISQSYFFDLGFLIQLKTVETQIVLGLPPTGGVLMVQLKTLMVRMKIHLKI